MDGGGGGAISGRLPGGGCAIGRGIGVLDNSQQLGKPKMGYAFCTTACFCCRRNFSYNPLRVPSFHDPRSGREPICLRCVEMVNPDRIKRGLKPIVPLPEAYDPYDPFDRDRP